jgi:hypothetical protein
LGQVLELEFGVDLTIGPALEEGFYYDCFMGDKVRAQQLCGCTCVPRNDEVTLIAAAAAAMVRQQRYFCWSSAAVD